MRRLLSLFALILAALAPALSAAQAPKAAARTIDIKATDGVVLKASYFAAPKPGPGLLLLHACNADRSSWTSLATAAASKGTHVLALDFRGFGESGGPRFAQNTQQQGIIDTQWPLDVDAALAWLASQPGVDKARLAAGGASCGVNQSVLLARRHPEVRTVVLLSGGLTAPAREFLRNTPSLPVFAAASRRDSGAVDSMRWALGWSRNPNNTFVEYKAAGHGAEMFAVEKELEPRIVTWLDTNLRGASATKPATVTAPKPTEVEAFWVLLNSPGGALKARQKYDEVKKAKRKDVVLFPETETNLVGYQLLQGGNPKDALVVFQMNNDAYPSSANTYDSISDAYLALGQNAEARKLAEKAIQMLATDVEASAQFKQLVRESAEKKLSEIK